MQKQERRRQAKKTVSKRREQHREQRQKDQEKEKALLAAEEEAAREINAATLLTRVARGHSGRKKARDTKVFIWFAILYTILL